MLLVYCLNGVMSLNSARQQANTECLQVMCQVVKGVDCTDMVGNVNHAAAKPEDTKPYIAQGKSA